MNSVGNSYFRHDCNILLAIMFADRIVMLTIKDSHLLHTKMKWETSSLLSIVALI